MSNLITPSPYLSETVSRLQAADQQYYNGGTAALTDTEYDNLRSALREADPKNPYLLTVGAPAAKHLGKVLLSMHMGSQEKVKTKEEALAWANEYVKASASQSIGARDFTLIVSDKLDGSSVEVTYVNGQFTRAATRGDGIVGSDITKNARLWPNLPKSINQTGTVTVRGEAMFPVSVWRDIIKVQNPESSNPRNEANGTIMRSSGENNQHITFNAFDHSGDFTTQEEKFQRLEALKFSVVRYSIVETANQLIQTYEASVEGRGTYDFECDGLILAVNNLAKQAALGYTSGNCPRGQVAWKYESQKTVTTVKEFELSHGHTGAIIPTMKVVTVHLAGVNISSILMNNFQYIKELNVGIGDLVEISRAGDVIPFCERVVEKHSVGYYQAPTNCPTCDSVLVAEGRIIKCVNEDCDSLIFQRVRNWINKTNMMFFGDSLLEALMNSSNPLVRDIPDLYTITASDLASMTVGNGVFGDSMAKKVIAEIDKTRVITTDLLMGSLSIKFLGRSMARHIGLELPADYLTISVQDLASKDNMGPNKAREMLKSVKSRADLISRMTNTITVTPFKKPAVSGGELSGITVCLTGVRMTPDEKARLAAAGGVEKSGVSAGLSFLVQKDTTSESSKSLKAKSLGVRVISLDEFRTMIP